MNATRVAVTAGTVMVLAACGSGSVSTSGAVHASRAAASAATAPTAAPVDTGTAGRICAAVNAMTFAGDSGADAISTAAKAYGVTQAQVVGAIDGTCPQFKRIVPPGA